ncbi:putative alkaline phosphatase [Paratrimastix pyriformis]|uniref:alkaline phosphatase n=1 Tax=Paratrimastix pyriformis TaxID=342808 RepID=A0ABQ8UGM5_9EUKA|nr:putative alkaline phosphatase [Paratrimastix pyriformis]
MLIGILIIVSAILLISVVDVAVSISTVAAPGVWHVFHDEDDDDSDSDDKPKNVIFLIVDGCGMEHYTISRWFKGAPLNIDGLQTGLVRTFIADSVIADSAPSASAYATGVITNDKLISVGPVPTPSLMETTPTIEARLKPHATLLEGARLQGKSVGVVATSHTCHATPGAFIGHAQHRSLEYDIMEQGVYQGLDVMFGGGSIYFTPRTSDDQEDLQAIAKSMGYQVARNKSELATLVAGKKAIGIFDSQAYNDYHLCPEVDRADLCPTEPTLAEMTTKALGLLATNPKGFFVMVEGSQVDFASHANDARTLIGELLQYDEAAKVVLDWARQRDDTLVVLVSDHNTGGLSLGNSRTSKTYPQQHKDYVLPALRAMTRSAQYIADQLDNQGWTVANVQAQIKAGWGASISDDLAQRVIDLVPASLDHQNAVCEALSANLTLLGWTTHGHVGGDVPLFAYAPKHHQSWKPTGLLHHTELNKHLQAKMGLDLAATTDRLYVDATKLFAAYNVTITTQGNSHNRVLLVDGGSGKLATFHQNKNQMIIGKSGEVITLEGVCVHINADATYEVPERFYVPRQALELMTAKWVDRRIYPTPTPASPTQNSDPSIPFSPSYCWFVRSVQVTFRSSRACDMNLIG